LGGAGDQRDPSLVRFDRGFHFGSPLTLASRLGLVCGQFTLCLKPILQIPARFAAALQIDLESATPYLVLVC
jgi:hypothetical protein